MIKILVKTSHKTELRADILHAVKDIRDGEVRLRPQTRYTMLSPVCFQESLEEDHEQHMMVAHCDLHQDSLEHWRWEVGAAVV